MVDNSTLTYPGVDSVLTWQPRNQVLHSFLVAVLNTILTYQATTIAFDLLTGFKPRGQAKVSDISSLLLSEEAAPLSVLAAFFPFGRIASLKQHGCTAPCHRSQHVSMSKPLPTSTIVKFLVILLAAPTISFVGIVLSLEQDRILTFQDTNFGGLTVGLGPSRQGSKDTDHRYCERNPIRLGAQETQLVEVLTCRTKAIRKNPFKFPALGVNAEINISKNIPDHRVPPGSMAWSFRNEKRSELKIFHVDIVSGEETYRLKTSVSVQEAKDLMNRGLQELAPHCRESPSSGIQVTNQESDSALGDEKWTIRLPLDCEASFDAEIMNKAYSAMISPLTIVSSDTFEVLRLSTNKYVSGEKLPFLCRRRSLIQVLPLAIMTIVTVLCRLVVRLFTNNDIHKGVELVMKHSLGMNCCDSMLQSSGKIRYNEVCQEEGGSYAESTDTKYDNV